MFDPVTGESSFTYQLEVTDAHDDVHADTRGALRRRPRRAAARRPGPNRTAGFGLAVGARLRQPGDVAGHRSAGPCARVDIRIVAVTSTAGGGTMTTYGVMFRREWPADRLLDYARQVEAHDLDELWVVEDLTFHGGFTQATAALAATSRINVGIGIAPAVVRNVAYTAMEIATLAQMFPGRFHMGFGHGVDFWIEQVGAAPASWMSSLRETVEVTMRLLAGENVTLDGDYVHLDAVQLAHPAAGRCHRCRSVSAVRNRWRSRPRSAPV